MKIVAAVFADFTQAPFGGPSQLTTALADQPILVRTLRRVAQAEGPAARCLFVAPPYEAAAAELLRASGVADRFDLLATDRLPRPRRLLLTAARKWNLDSWRGGLLGATWFDEFVYPPAVAAVFNHYHCDAVLCFEGHQALLDPEVATAMVQRAETTRHESKMVFTQAPPGLAGLLLRREGLQEIIDLDIPVGLVLSYRPELAQSDPIIHEACYHVAPEVVQTRARFVADTRRSRELLAAALAELGEDVSAAPLCNWARAPGHDRAGGLPVELELELTTADPLPETTLRPRGNRVPSRQVADL